MDAQRFRSLSPRNRALVAFAVLCDGREAAQYLSNDALLGPQLKRAAEELSAQDAELRMPFAATMLRQALSQLK